MIALFLSPTWRGFGIFLLTFIVYFLTMMPDLGFTDSGELAAAAHVLGIAHPTGYPLYTIIAHVWSLISPFSTVYDLNLLAGIFTAMSVSLFSLILNEILEMFQGDSTHKAIISTSIALMFGFGSTVWSQGTALEVYSLQLFLMMLIILYFMKAMKHGGMSKYLLVWSFLIGLSFTNHGTTILLAPAMILGYFANWKQDTFSFSKDTFRGLLPLIPWFAIGFLVWIYLPLRSAQHPIVNWGEVHRNWDAFAYHAFGKQYQVWMFNDGTAKENFPKYWNALIDMTSWILLIPMMYGIYVSFTKSKILSLFLIALIIGNLVYALNYGIHDIETYFLSGFIPVFIFAALGILTFMKHKPLLYVLPFLPLLNLTLNYAENDKHDDYAVPSYISLMIDPLPKNSVIISSQWDYLCSGFMYKQIVENYRPDIIRPVFITSEVLQSEVNIAQSLAKIPQGLAFRIMYPPPSGLPELPLLLLKTSFDPLINSISDKSGHLYEGLSTTTANELLNLAQYAWMTGRSAEANAYLNIAERVQSDNQTLRELRQVIISSPNGPQR